MTYQTERENFIARFAAMDGKQPIHTATADARKLLRYARTLHRLAEAECNGDWPYGNGRRAMVQCAVCEAGVDKSDLKTAARSCGSCRTAAKTTALAASYGYVAEVQGDPRGYVLRLWPAGTTRAQMDTSSNAWGVPS